jgi:hypothetical protein
VSPLCPKLVLRALADRRAQAVHTLAKHESCAVNVRNDEEVRSGATRGLEPAAHVRQYLSALMSAQFDIFRGVCARGMAEAMPELSGKMGVIAKAAGKSYFA